MVVAFIHSFILYFRFWGTCADHAGLLHRYTHGKLVCCLHPPSPISGISPHGISPQPSHPPLSLLQHPPTDPSMWCSHPCVHVFSLFNTRLWVRTCGVWFSVLVLVRWERWFSRFIHVPTKDIIFYGCIVFHGFMCHIFLVQSIIDGHLGWFQVFAMVNSAAMNIRVHVSL